MIDRYGLPVTAASPAALDTYDHAASTSRGFRAT